jgi:hypothetical protein
MLCLNGHKIDLTEEIHAYNVEEYKILNS